MDRDPGAELRPTPAELTKLVDLLVYAPIGLGATIVNDGPAAIKRARQEFNNARFIGQMAVTQGQAELRRRLEQAAARSAGGSPSARTDAIDVSSVRATSSRRSATLKIGSFRWPSSMRSWHAILMIFARGSNDL